MIVPKKILMIACSERAWQLEQELAFKIKKQYPDTECICKVKCSSLEEISEQNSLKELVGEWFLKVDAIVFFCATGIAVRTIAPYIVHKSKDPAVVVIDETGEFCISLLSGHFGGANALTEQLARLQGAIPVITTATDKEHKFAVDVFAVQNDLVITDWKLAKKISALVLVGKKINICSELPIEQKEEIGQSNEFVICTREELEENTSTNSTCILISKEKQVQKKQNTILQLIPKIVTVGVGCRKGTSESDITTAILSCLQENKIDIRSVSNIASIDLKENEEGILAFCEQYNLPFLTFSAEQLKEVNGSVSESAFVEQVTGVSNVCERSALVASNGILLAKKKIYGKVTVALAEEKRSLTVYE